MRCRRAQKSCAICHERKVRCNRGQPCDQCLKQGQPEKCHYSSLDGRPTAQKHLSQPVRSPGLAHHWDRDGLMRGRSHISWMLQELAPLTQFARDAVTYRHTFAQWRDSGWWKGLSDELAFPNTIYHELPATSVAQSLMARYFDTFGAVYPIIDPQTFHPEFQSMLSDPPRASMLLVLQSLTMLALASATLPDRLIPSSTAIRWLDLAICYPRTLLQVHDVGLDALRIMALCGLAKQTLRSHETSDYMSTGSGIRAAMAHGLHRSGDPEMRRLWCVFVDLDLHSALAAGLLPTAPNVSRGREGGGDDGSEGTSPSSSESTPMGPEEGKDPLTASLSTRYSIVAELNTDSPFRLERAIDLSRRLTSAMGASRLENSWTDPQEPFAARYHAMVYNRYLAALHRPFILTPQGYQSPASRSLLLRLSTQHVEKFVSQKHDQREPFNPLTMMTSDSITRLDTLHAISVLVLDLYRAQDGGATDADALLLSPADRLHGLESLLCQYDRSLDRGGGGDGSAREARLLCSLVLAHRQVTVDFPEWTSGYSEQMRGFGREAGRKYFRSESVAVTESAERAFT